MPFSINYGNIGFGFNGVKTPKKPKPVVAILTGTVDGVPFLTPYRSEKAALRAQCKFPRSVVWLRNGDVKKVDHSAKNNQF